MAKKKTSKKDHQSFRLTAHDHSQEKVVMYVAIAIILGVLVGYFLKDQAASVLGISIGY